MRIKEGTIPTREDLDRLNAKNLVHYGTCEGYNLWDVVLDYVRMPPYIFHQVYGYEMFDKVCILRDVIEDAEDYLAWDCVTLE